MAKGIACLELSNFFEGPRLDENIYPHSRQSFISSSIIDQLVLVAKVDPCSCPKLYSVRLHSLVLHGPKQPRSETWESYDPQPALRRTVAGSPMGSSIFIDLCRLQRSDQARVSGPTNRLSKD